MFETLRKMIFPIIIIVLVFFVAMIILQWGLEFTGRQQFAVKNIAGTINGEEILLETYNRVYNNLVQQETQRSGGEVTDSRLRELEQSAWQQLVYDRLLAQEAAKYNIVVTDQELYSFLRMSPPQYLQSMPAFQTNGQFDYQKYVNAMADPQASSFWSQIEPMVHADMQKMKMQEMVIQAVEVSEDELKDAYVAANEKIKVGYINVPYNRFTTASHNASEDELKAFYDAHKDQYKLDDRAVVSFALVEKQPSAADSAEAYNTIKALYDSAAAGADFAELARTYSQDGSAAAGGDLGSFAPGQMIPEFDRVVFTMKDGDLSQPFRTQFGWHIVKHHGYTEEEETPPGKAKPEKVRKAKASHILIKIEVSQGTLDAAYQKMQAIVTATKEIGFDKAVEQEGLKVKKTVPFPKGGSIPDLGFDQPASDFVFSHEPKTVSEVMENNSSVFVLQVDERLPAGPATYDEVKSRIKLDAFRQWVATQCLDTLKVIYAGLRGGTPWGTVAKVHGAEYVESDWITRASYVGEVGRDATAIGSAFALQTAGQMSEPIGYDNGAVVFKLLERQTADLNKFAEKRDSVLSAVKMSKQQTMYNSWFEGLMKSSKIDNNLERLRRSGEPM
ncbi:MAG: peptidylprolyl isomerase [Candidatus Zixiibacteriota bacterium]